MSVETDPIGHQVYVLLERVFVKDGDVLVSTIEGIGSLRNELTTNKSLATL